MDFLDFAKKDGSFLICDGEKIALSKIKELTGKIVLVVPISHSHYLVPPIGLGYLTTSIKTS